MAKMELLCKEIAEITNRDPCLRGSIVPPPVRAEPPGRGLSVIQESIISGWLVSRLDVRIFTIAGCLGQTSRLWLLDFEISC